MPANPVTQLRQYLRKKRELQLFKQSSSEDVFTHIYEENKWGDGDSRSGKGSNLDRTKPLRQRLPQVLRELGIRSLLDIPCGDFFWMKETNISVERYIGADIVASLAQENQRLYGSSKRQFLQLDLLRDELPTTDAILCRDCLVHLCFEDIEKAVVYIKASGATYLLRRVFLTNKKNKDIVSGKHRSLNMRIPPLHWPKPIMEIPEHITNNSRGSKCLAVWKITDIR